jgi:hypothetical protein
VEDNATGRIVSICAWKKIRNSVGFSDFVSNSLNTDLYYFPLWAGRGHDRIALPIVGKFKVRARLNPVGLNCPLQRDNYGMLEATKPWAR